MRQASKIGVIILVLAVIIFIVIKAFSKTDDESGEIVTKHNLVKAVEQRADNEIVDKAFSDANPAYNDLLNMLKTEEGQGNYPPEDIEQARKITVRAYAPIFADYAKSYFNSTGWGGAKVNEIKAETQQLLAFNMMESISSVQSKLNDVLSIISKYNEARNVVGSARSCYTVDAALSCKNKASSLLSNSYIMRSDIKAALSAVPQVAKKTCAGAIKNRISVMTQYDEYGSRYLSPENEQQAWNWLNSYKSALGVDSNYNEIYSYIMQLTD